MAKNGYLFLCFDNDGFDIWMAMLYYIFPDFPSQSYFVSHWLHGPCISFREKSDSCFSVMHSFRRERMKSKEFLN